MKVVYVIAQIVRTWTLIVLIKEKLEISSLRDQIKILTHLRVGILKKLSINLVLLNIKLNVPEN